MLAFSYVKEAVKFSDQEHSIRVVLTCPKYPIPHP
jgi:hypothetical protein